MCARGHAQHAFLYVALYSRGCGGRTLFAKGDALCTAHTLEAVDGELCLLEVLGVLEVMRCVLLMLGSVNGRFCLLEVLDVLDVMCRTPLCMLEAVESGFVVCGYAGRVRGDALRAVLHVEDCGGWA
jgi:hypothetical protein